MASYNPPLENLPIFNGNEFITPPSTGGGGGGGSGSYVEYPTAQGNINLLGVNVIGEALFNDTATFESTIVIDSTGSINFNDGSTQSSAYTGAKALAGSYTIADITIDTDGKISAIANGTITTPTLGEVLTAGNVASGLIDMAENEIDNASQIRIINTLPDASANNTILTHSSQVFYIQNNSTSGIISMVVEDDVGTPVSIVDYSSSIVDFRGTLIMNSKPIQDFDYIAQSGTSTDNTLNNLRINNNQNITMSGSGSVNMTGTGGISQETTAVNTMGKTTLKGATYDIVEYVGTPTNGTASNGIVFNQNGIYGGIGTRSLGTAGGQSVIVGNNIGSFGTLKTASAGGYISFGETTTTMFELYIKAPTTSTYTKYISIDSVYRLLLSATTYCSSTMLAEALQAQTGGLACYGAGSVNILGTGTFSNVSTATNYNSFGKTKINMETTTSSGLYNMYLDNATNTLYRKLPVYGSFYSTITQSISNTATETKFVFDATAVAVNCQYNATTTSRLSVNVNGVYQINISPNVSFPAGGGYFDFWIKLNNVNIANSNSQIRVGNNDKTLPFVEFQLSLLSTDYFEICGWASTAGSVLEGLSAVPAGVTPAIPATPSLIVNIKSLS